MRAFVQEKRQTEKENRLQLSAYNVFFCEAHKSFFIDVTSPLVFIVSPINLQTGEFRSKFFVISEACVEEWNNIDCDCPRDGEELVDAVVGL